MFFSLFDSIIYSKSYLECHKKYSNSFELNKNVILKTFDLNFRHTFDWTTNNEKVVQKFSLEEFFSLKTLKQKVTADY